jgi:TRAP-type uncharacterized transport system fused permease subunit
MSPMIERGMYEVVLGIICTALGITLFTAGCMFIGFGWNTYCWRLLAVVIILLLLVAADIILWHRTPEDC